MKQLNCCAKKEQKYIQSEGVLKMKIQVGKTYQSAGGKTWLVECKLIFPPVKDYPYLVTSVGVPGHNWVSEEGVSRLQMNNLLPPKVKKTYWIALFRASPICFYFSTLDGVKSAYPEASGYAEVSFEVEE